MARKSNVKRKDGRFAVQVYLGRDDGNKRKYKTVYGRTQKEANEKAQEIKIALQKGIDVTNEYITFGDWADSWIRIKEPEVSHARAIVYKSNIKHLKASLAAMPITKIRTADIQEIILSLSQHNPNTGKPMARETLSGIKSTAIQIMQLAIDNRVMDYNPAIAVKIPNSRDAQKRRSLSIEEQQWINDTPHRAQRAAMIMMYSGLRRGELIPLTWNDIDLKNKTVTVSKATEFINGKPVLKDSAKTPASIRTVDIPQRLVDFLKNELVNSIYVCSNTSGQMHTEASWRRMWESYLTDLNLKYGDFSPFGKQYKSKYDPDGVPFVIPKITPHWLRHTFCTMLYLAGVDILTAKIQMGHADIRTTLEIYTHLDSIHKRKSMSKLDAYLLGDQKTNASQMQVNET